MDSKPRKVKQDLGNRNANKGEKGFLRTLGKGYSRMTATRPLRNVRVLSRKGPVIVNITRTACVTSMEPGSKGEWTGILMHEQMITSLY